MAINSNPLFTPGQNLTPEQLALLLGQRPADWMQTQAGGWRDEGVGDSGGSPQYSAPGTRRVSWLHPDGGRFGPQMVYEPSLGWEGAGEGAVQNPNGTGQTFIYQPRNESTWGSNDVADVWDERGNYVGTSSGATDARSLANLAATAVGGYYLNGALAGAEAGAGAGAGAAGGTAGSTAAPAATGGVNWSAVGSGALKGAGANAGLTAIRGGDGSDILRAGLIGGVTGGIGGYGAQAGWSPAATGAAQGATGAALRGGGGSDVLLGAAMGGANSGLSASGGAPTSSGGGAMDDWDLSGSGGYYGDDWSFNTTYDGTQYLDPDSFDFGGSGLDFGSLAKQYGPTLAKLLMAGTAAYQARGGQKQTTSRDPWGPAQPYILDNLKYGADLAKQYRDQPFSPAQQQAYGNFAGLLNTVNAGAPGLMSGFGAMASGANNYDRANPRRPMTGGSMSLAGWQPGLLNLFPPKG